MYITVETNSILMCAALLSLVAMAVGAVKSDVAGTRKKRYNGPYSGEYLNRVAFPVGGMGAGMFCIEGTGAFSHVSVRHIMSFFNEPCTFAAVTVKGSPNLARVLEGPVPAWKVFGSARTGNGAAGSSYGFPRFADVSFEARFPFATVNLVDERMPLKPTITAWSPFVPGDSESACLPVGGLEYTFENVSSSRVDAIFSYNTKNFMAVGRQGDTILPIDNGFVLSQSGTEENPEFEGAFAAFVSGEKAVVDHCWFKGGWWDSLTLAWKNIQDAAPMNNPPVAGSCPGASLFVPFSVPAGGKKTVRLLVAWYVPQTAMRFGKDPEQVQTCKNSGGQCCADLTYEPWYAGRFSSIGDVAAYWRNTYDDLLGGTTKFTKTLYDTTLPDEVMEAVGANLTILKSPTVLRQKDGRLWCFEGCCDNTGCCHGTCTHVWNYAQALPHLFPDLERTLRHTEFFVSQDGRGHQMFRTSLPIRPVLHDFHAASDGQLGGIMKVYREWRVSGDGEWLKTIWPNVKQSLEYCIETWDPRGKGILEEPHHNTYDIEYWGPDGHCGSFYLGALAAAVAMGSALGEDVTRWKGLLENGRGYLEAELFNGEYFIQKIQTKGLNATFTPLDVSDNGPGYRDVIRRLNTEGPKYQYGTGCLSDGVLGFWMAKACGLDDIVDAGKVRDSLRSIYRYNLKRDLSSHANPQRPAYALGDDGGLLLCTWPHGGELSIPFVYSNEVWTGIEYQVASHLMMEEMVEEGLDVVRVCRDRYDGRVRNPFNEYECGHWYARALSSYALIQGLTGVRYDAVEKTLYIDSRVGDNFRCILVTEGGYGTVGLASGKPFFRPIRGTVDIRTAVVSGKKAALER